MWGREGAERGKGESLYWPWCLILIMQKKMVYRSKGFIWNPLNTFEELLQTFKPIVLVNGNPCYTNKHGHQGLLLRTNKGLLCLFFFFPLSKPCSNFCKPSIHCIPVWGMPSLSLKNQELHNDQGKNYWKLRDIKELWYPIILSPF